MQSSRTTFSPSFDQSIRRIGTAATALLRDSLDNTSVTMTRMGDLLDAARGLTSVGTSRSRRTCSTPCCPPEPECCPPQCLLRLTRRALPGEVVMVPFRIRNASGNPKTYDVGIRPMTNERQPDEPAPSQPTLNKTKVTVGAGQAALVEMRIDLSKGYRAGEQYEATIVVREKEINQNICFTLILDAPSVPEATPCDEGRLKSHFVSWQYHFYCDEPSRASVDVTGPFTPGRG